MLQSTIVVYNKTEANAIVNIVKKEVYFVGKLYTCNEVAERYSVKVITVWDWIRKGKLEAVKMPKGYRVSAEALETYESALSTT